MLKFCYIFYALFLSTNIVNAKIHFKDIKFKKLSSSRVQVEAVFDKNIVEIPRLKFEDSKIHLIVPQTEISSKIIKKLPLGNDADMAVMGEKLSSEDSRISILLPYPTKNIKQKVHVRLKDEKVFIDFPLKKINKEVKKKEIIKIDSKDVYDEGFLKKLIDEKNAKNNLESGEVINSDVVKSSFSSLPKEREQFSLEKQIGKFMVFLVIVIAVFYGIVLFFKKSVLSKNKLGFINSTKIVEVLNTTYIAPKRSIVLVRVHKQIFLIGNSEKGLHSLGELKDMAGLLKEGEKVVSGDNFDISLQSVSESDKEFSLKESMEMESLKKQEAKNRLSEQIKNKVKGLKSLQ